MSRTKRFLRVIYQSLSSVPALVRCTALINHPPIHNLQRHLPAMGQAEILTAVSRFGQQMAIG